MSTSVVSLMKRVSSTCRLADYALALRFFTRRLTRCVRTPLYWRLLRGKQTILYKLLLLSGSLVGTLEVAIPLESPIDCYVLT